MKGATVDIVDVGPGRSLRTVGHDDEAVFERNLATPGNYRIESRRNFKKACDVFKN